MKLGFYPRLALTGIARNRRLYLPYLLTCVGMVAMHYIIGFLAGDPAVLALHGGDYLSAVLGMGSGIIALFAGLFLFYTHSFLMRRRKKEFGLYNILGMGKRHIALLLLCETALLALAALAAGLGVGIALAKLAELGLLNVLGAPVGYGLLLSPDAVWQTLRAFAVIFLLLYLDALRQVRFASAIALLHSENSGEKPPRANWLLGLAGVALLGAAYYIAVTIKNPITAITAFFLAVAMVIVATYLIMIAGSVLFCRLLQRRKSYYYKPAHFVSVSSMVYRMKRNGAGLASICILATMVMVMLSMTASLYAGAENSLHTRYPREIDATVTMTGVDGLATPAADALQDELLALAEQNGAQPQNVYSFRTAEVTGMAVDGVVETDVSKLDGMYFATYENVYTFFFVPLEDYNRMTGQAETLAPGEALACNLHADLGAKTLSFNNGQSFNIVRYQENVFENGIASVSLLPSVVLVVPDLPAAIQGLDRLANYLGDPMLTCQWFLGFDTGVPADAQVALRQVLDDAAGTLAADARFAIKATRVESRANERYDFMALDGGLFYLGILLSIVFLFATVLIIYYKQISEGYEDQSRFAIMRKVGMARAAIRRSINSQMLTVFLLPLALAACHQLFAFPIVARLLLAFGFDDTALFAGVTAGCVLVFGVLYTLVYRLTSNAYYDIVSGARESRG